MRPVKKEEITADVVRCLLADQVPTLAGLPVTPVEVDGWDNTTFRIGSQHLVRLPSDDGYVPAVDKEHRWLPHLGPALPQPIPTPVFRGRPGCGFPRPWSLYRWLPGQTASRGNVTDLTVFARDVGRFLTALQAIGTDGGPPAGAHSFGRGGPLSFYDADVRSCLACLPPGPRRKAVRHIWETSLSAPPNAGDRWFHGDMAPSNLLVQDGRLSAVIDFGTCGVGDPACDLVLAWTFLDAPSRDALRQAARADDPMWSRAKGWALWKALLTIAEPGHDASVRRYGWAHNADDIVESLIQAN